MFNMFVFQNIKQSFKTCLIHLDLYLNLIYLIFFQFI